MVSLQLQGYQLTATAWVEASEMTRMWAISSRPCNLEVVCPGAANGPTLEIMETNVFRATAYDPGVGRIADLSPRCRPHQHALVAVFAMVSRVLV